MSQVAWNLSSPDRPLEKLIKEMTENRFGENSTPPQTNCSLCPINGKRSL